MNTFPSAVSCSTGLANVLQEVMASAIRPVEASQPGTFLEAPPGLELAARRLQHLLKHCEPDGSQGSYVGWITRIAYEVIRERGAFDLLSGLLIFFHEGGSLREYEDLIAKSLGLASPLASLRSGRLELLRKRADPLIDAKLKEMEDPDFQITPVGQEFSAPFLLWNRNTQFDAYLSDRSVVDLMHEIRKRGPGLLQPIEAARRLEKRRAALRMVGYPTVFTSPNIAGAFRMLGDRYSLGIARALEAGEFGLYFYQGGDFDRVVVGLVQRVQTCPVDPTTQNAVYFYPGLLEERGVMIVRSNPISLPESLSGEDLFFEVLAMIAHEYRHHQEGVPRERRTPIVTFRRELKAHGREFLWRAEYGDKRFLEQYATESHAGFAMHFRDNFEKFYGTWFNLTSSG